MVEKINDKVAIDGAIKHSKELPSTSIKLDLVEINSITTGKLLNVKHLVSEFSIYEDLQSPFITCNIVLTDSLALSGWFPLVGQETIHIKFETPHPAFTRSVDITLDIIAVDKFKKANIRTERFVIRAVSGEHIRDWNTKIRKSYREMPVSAMATSIFDEFLAVDNSLEASESEGNRTIVIPNMSPARAMKFLCREAKSSAFKSSNYIFYQTVDGFFFKPLDELIRPLNDDESRSTDRAKDEYFVTDMDIGNRSSPAPGGVWSPNTYKPFEFTKIMHFEFVNLFENRRTLKSGGFESTLRTIDPVTSNYLEKRYNYFEEGSALKYVTSGAPQTLITDGQNQYMKNGESRIDYTMENSHWNTENPDQKPEFLQFSNASFSLLDDIVLDVVVPGDSSRRAGDVIIIQFPEFGGLDDNLKELNKYVSGQYLVIANRYIYNTEGFKTVMRCAKNCYEASVSQ